jgi:hypothetical protein
MELFLVFLAGLCSTGAASLGASMVFCTDRQAVLFGWSVGFVVYVVVVFAAKAVMQ